MDNASYHTSKNIENFFTDPMINIIYLPPRSPDLNPIENLWSVMKRNVGKRNPETFEDLKITIYEEFWSIDEHIVENLIMSMNHRIKAIIEVDGEIIDY